MRRIYPVKILRNKYLHYFLRQICFPASYEYSNNILKHDHKRQMHFLACVEFPIMSGGCISLAQRCLKNNSISII